MVYSPPVLSRLSPPSMRRFSILTGVALEQVLRATGVHCAGCHPKSITRDAGSRAGSQTASHQREIDEWWDLEETLMTHSTDTML